MSALDSAGDALKREVGGLPVIAWAGIIGAGVLVGKRLAGGGLFGGGAASGTPTPFIDPNLTGYTATGEPATEGTIGGGPAAGSFSDNASWARAAVDYLVATGVNPVEAGAAIAVYLTTGGGTDKQKAIVNTAIRRLGSPPEGVPAPVEAVPPTSNPTGAPRGYRATTVQAPYGLGENLQQVASRIRKPTTQGGEGVTTTVDGRPLTSSYLASVNGLKVSTSRALARGTRIVY